MADIALMLGLVAALIGVTGFAFMRPDGVYWRSAAGVVLTVAAASAVWLAASPAISNEAGFGAFAIWLAVVALSVLGAAAACIAATARHVLNALRAR